MTEAASSLVFSLGLIENKGREGKGGRVGTTGELDGEERKGAVASDWDTVTLQTSRFIFD